jgi:hypothetical protein
VSKQKHKMVIGLDSYTIEGHIFGNLSVETEYGWMLVERRCQLCHKTPMALMSVDGSIVACTGLVVGDPL